MNPFRIAAVVLLMLFAVQSPAPAAYRHSYGSWTNYKSKGYYYRPYYYAPSYHHEVHYYNKYPRRYYYYNPYKHKYWGYLDLDHPDKYYLLTDPTDDVAKVNKASTEDKTLKVLNEMPVMKDKEGKETGERLVPPPKDKDLLPPE